MMLPIFAVLTGIVIGLLFRILDPFEVAVGDPADIADGVRGDRHVRDVDVDTGRAIGRLDRDLGTTR